uniref:FBD domain-containing protein n=1 Tax=Aegilops tauschii TaxID=37682 RepID=N1QSY5_AEGTA
MRRGARVIHVIAPRRSPAMFVGVPFVSCHLKVLKLSSAKLDRRILGELSSCCTSLEELDLKDCLVAADEIVFVSLKTLIMLKCKIGCDFSIAAPNLFLLRLIAPYLSVPLFKNLGSLVTGTIMVDDYFLSDDFSEDC